jgi:DNA-binding beta-propeller fold protein YncE
MVSFTGASGSPKIVGAAPGSTCQNSVDPLASGCETWLARYAFPGSSDDMAAATAISPDGARVFVAGHSGRVQTLEDFTTTAYDTATGQQLWVATYDGPGHFVDEARAIATSPDGSRVYVTGKSAAVQVTSSAPTYEFATIAYDAVSGAQLWLARFNGVSSNPGLPVSSGSAEARALAVSPDGSRIYVTGQSEGTLGLEYATVAYDSNGSQVWVSNYNGTASDYNAARAIAISPDGASVYVTGVSAGATTKYDFATVAYNAASGVQLWAARYDGPSNSYDEGSSVTTSPDGSHVYVTGNSTGANFYPDYATISYDSGSGAQQWASRYSGPGNAYNSPAILRASADGQRVFVTGENITFIDDQHSVSEYPTVAYDATTGAQQWVSKYPGPNNDSSLGVSLAVSPDSQSVVVTQMGPDNGGDYVTIRYGASDGAQQWLAHYDGPRSGFDVPAAIAISKNGAKVIVTGSSSGSATHSDFATIQYDALTGTKEWLSRYDGLGVNDEHAVATAASPDGTTVYVAGWSGNGTDFGLDYTTAAYDAATGAQKWVSRYHRVDSSYEIATAMALSHDGQRIYVTGYTNAGYNGAPSEYTTVAYDTATGAQLWVTMFVPNTDSDINTGTPYAIVVSPDDSRVYVTGNVAGSAGGFTSYDRFGTVAFDASSGAKIWDSYYEGTSLQAGSNIAWTIGVSPDGTHVVVAGQAWDADTTHDFATISYDAATGVQEWAKTYDGVIHSFDAARALAISPDSSTVYVTGESYQVYNAYAYSTIAYDLATGAQKWQATYSGTAQAGDLPTAIVASPDGKRVYVTGLTSNNVTGGDYGTVAYDAASGAQIWVANYAQPGADFGMDVAVSPNSSLVFVTGESTGTLSHGDYATVIYDAETGAEKFAGRYDGPASADDVAAKLTVSTDGTRVFVAGYSAGAGTGDDFVTIAYDTLLIGVTPSPPVAVSGVVSRMTHGSAGTFDIALPLSGTPGIECRSGGSDNHFSLIFTFSNPLTSVGGATIASGTGKVRDSALSNDRRQYIVNLSGVINAQVLTVSLVNVNDSAGNHSNSIQGRIALLLGDENSNKVVSNTDVASIKAQVAAPVTSSNFRDDVNANGVISNTDVSSTKAQVGASLP